VGRGLSIFYLVTLLAAGALPCRGSITRHAEGGLLYQIISSDYDVFEFRLDSTKIMGADQYVLHYGSSQMIYKGNVEPVVEILQQCNSPCGSSVIGQGDSYLVIAKKQQYRYLIDGYQNPVKWLAFYKLEEERSHSTTTALKQYFTMVNAGHSGSVDISYGNRSRLVGELRNGQHTGVWMYQGDHTRLYITYDKGNAVDTSYHFQNIRHGWQLCKKTYLSSDIKEEWNYGRANYRERSSKMVLRSHKQTYKDYSLHTRYDYHLNESLKSILTIKDHNNSDIWSQNVVYLHGPAYYFDQYGKDSLSGHYHFGRQTGSWLYSTADTAYTVQHLPIPRQDQDTTITELPIHPPSEGLLCSLSLLDEKIHGKMVVQRAGAMHSTATYIEGIVDGPCTSYHSDSTISQVKNYRMGKLHGSQSRYTHTGNLRAQQHYHDGLLHGTVRSYDGDYLSKTEIYSNGHIIDVSEYNQRGDTITQLRYERGLPTGTKALKNGGFATLIDGVYNGPAKLYHKDGHLIGEGSFKNGRKHGPWKEWRPREGLYSTMYYNSSRSGY